MTSEDERVGVFVRLEATQQLLVQHHPFVAQTEVTGRFTNGGVHE